MSTRIQQEGMIKCDKWDLAPFVMGMLLVTLFCIVLNSQISEYAEPPGLQNCQEIANNCLELNNYMEHQIQNLVYKFESEEAKCEKEE